MEKILLSHLTYSSNITTFIIEEYHFWIRYTSLLFNCCKMTSLVVPTWINLLIKVLCHEIFSHILDMKNTLAIKISEIPNWFKKTAAILGETALDATARAIPASLRLNRISFDSGKTYGDSYTDKHSLIKGYAFLLNAHETSFSSLPVEWPQCVIQIDNYKWR